ncbi:MAG TPA: redoxin domain-containing protein [Verrucomicrobiae bacterium]|nr:redoxin domain-containing protein [Verrucomicrobiae bacterium]
MRAIFLAGFSVLFATSAFAQLKKAPNFTSDAVWIDTGPSGAKVPHSIKGYRGHVLLVDFWEYTCINCIRDFAVLKSWYAKYHSYGFDIVGVHYGEFAIGFSVANVREAAKRFRLPWPIVADVHGSIWNAYHSDVWPNRYLVDQNGDIVLHVEGETGNRALEEKIRQLLEPSHPEVSKIPLDPPEDTFAPECGIPTQETYVGDWFGRGALENSQGYRDGSVVDFHPVRKPDDGGVILSGKWRTEHGGVISDSTRGIAELRYHARSVYSVLSVTDSKKPVRVYLLQDGKPVPRIDAGVDVRFDSEGSYIEVGEPRMYYLIKNAAFGSHLLELQPNAPGLTLHSFTYGNNCQQNFQQL